jgi:hypothetical protein
MQEKTTLHSAMNCSPQYFIAKICLVLSCLNICVTEILVYQCALRKEKVIENC